MSHATAPPPNLCIDFGTAMSKVAAFSGAGPAHEAVQALAIGEAAGRAHPLMTPSVLYVDDGRIFFGPAGLRRARAGVAAKRDPLLSFKAILSAQSPQDALGLRVRPSIDPTGTLRHRDALVLYLSYLRRLIGAALQLTQAHKGMDWRTTRLRYTSPRWRAQKSVEAAMESFFAESAVVADQLGDLLIGAEGVSIAQAKDALDRAAAGAAPAQIDCVLESHAAACAHAAFSGEQTRFLFVLDMGAGTTDFAAFRRDGETLFEIAAAQQTTGLANDEIDNALVDLIMRRAGRKPRNMETFWRTARLSARELKQDLFERGRTALEVDGKTILVKRDEFLRDDLFKQFREALSAAAERSLDVMLTEAAREPKAQATLLISGGGANLPFVRELAETLAARKRRGVDLKLAHFGQDWMLSHREDPDLRSALPQLGVAMGGALAHFVEPARPTQAALS